VDDLEKQLEAEGIDADVIAETLAMSKEQRQEEATDIVAQSVVHKIEKQLTKPEALPLSNERHSD